MTKFFYDRGWHGINIEPLPNMHALLMEQRPRDINLCVGLGSKRDYLPLHVVNNAFGRSTFISQIAQNFQKASKIETPYPQISRRILTLSDIYERFCKSQQEIHFCKIDVEGYEKQVLEGIADWNKFRPWIFILEAGIAHRPSWETMLLDNGYILALELEINKFYVDSEKEYLLKGFQNLNQFVAQNEIVKMVMQPVKFK